jgi:hypothetical protein
MSFMLTTSSKRDAADPPELAPRRRSPDDGVFEPVEMPFPKRNERFRSWVADLLWRLQVHDGAVDADGMAVGVNSAEARLRGMRDRFRAAPAGIERHLSQSRNHDVQVARGVHDPLVEFVDA